MLGWDGVLGFTVTFIVLLVYALMCFSCKLALTSNSFICSCILPVVPSKYWNSVLSTEPSAIKLAFNRLEASIKGCFEPSKLLISFVTETKLASTTTKLASIIPNLFVMVVV